MQYPKTELVLDGQGRVYHLGLSPSEVSDKIILVGDQDRVKLISSYFDTIEHSSQHREFACITGTYNGKRITALSSGIGTDNIDIVMNELDALFNIDLEKRENKDELTSLSIVRIGTCGILQADIPVHGYILSEYAAGLDNIGHFYQIEFTEAEEELNQAIQNHIQLPGEIKTYLTESSGDLFERLNSDQVFSGITVTSSGFYGPQGRQLRLKTKSRHLNDALSDFEFNGHRVVNFEMESSALFALGKNLGHQCGTICLGIANRPNREFSSGYQNEMLALIKYVLDRI